MRILSFDVGGSKISFNIVSENGCFINKTTTLPTPKKTDEIVRIFHDILLKNKIDGVAIATAGVVLNNKIMGKPNNLPSGYENIDFSQLITVPYIIENDANAAAWAEFEAGVLKNTKNGIMLTLGTDVGCAIIAEGQLIRGKSGAAGEVNFPCSGTSLRRIAANAGITNADCFEIYNAALAGEQPAIAIYQEWLSNFTKAIIKLNNLLDSEVIAVSGSLSKIIDYQQINTILKQLIQMNPPIIKPAEFSTEAGLIGAALLWLRNFNGEKK